MIRTHIRAVLKVYCWFRFRFSFCVCLGLSVCFFSGLALDYFVLVLFAFVVSDLVFSVLSQEIGREERLGNDSYLCQVGRKTLTLSINGSPTSESCVLR